MTPGAIEVRRGRGALTGSPLHFLMAAWESYMTPAARLCTFFYIQPQSDWPGPKRIGGHRF
jgi:hypothetical protein